MLGYIGKIEMTACCGGHCSDVNQLTYMNDILPREIKDKIIASPDKSFELELVCVAIREIEPEPESEEVCDIYHDGDEEDSEW